VSEEIGLNLQKDSWNLHSGIFYAYQYKHTYNENHRYEYANTVGYKEWQKSMPEKNVAVFSEYSHNITDKFIVTAGLRYRWTRKYFDSTITPNFPIPVPAYGFVNTSYPQITTSKKWQKVLPKLKLTYRMDRNDFLFFQYAQGFKNGGYNYDDYTPNAPTYEPERSETYEVGLNLQPYKSLAINSSFYKTNVKDLQVETIRSDITSYVENADKARIYGFENKVDYALTDNLNLHGSVSLIDAKFQNYVSSNVDYSGNRLLNVPRYTSEIGSQYNFTKNYYSYIALKSQGRTYFDKANSVEQSAYSYVNTKFGFKSKKLTWEFYIRNLLDKKYLNYAVSAGNVNAYNFGEPRRLGVSLTYNF